MLYSEILTALYGRYDRLVNSLISMREPDGVFVFFPEGYESVDDFDQVQFEFWPVHRIRQYLLAGGQTDEGLLDLLEDIDPAEEFLVMIVEEEERTSRRMVHIHKITNLGLN
jgi:hypothetical protein